MRVNFKIFLLYIIFDRCSKWRKSTQISDLLSIHHRWRETISASRRTSEMTWATLLITHAPPSRLESINSPAPVWAIVYNDAKSLITNATLTMTQNELKTIQDHLVIWTSVVAQNYLTAHSDHSNQIRSRSQRRYSFISFTNVRASA